MNYLFQDWHRNAGNIKGQLILVFFRFSNLISRSNSLLFIIGIPVLILYRVIVEWILCVEIPFRTKVGKSLRLYHGQSLVINNETIIGDNCTLRHCTTLGNKLLKNGMWSGSPVIGNNVDIGANVVVIGPVTVGDNVQIGAGSVITKDIRANCIVAGNPARLIKDLQTREEEDMLLPEFKIIPKV